jgi:hypothetical protein
MYTSCQLYVNFENPPSETPNGALRASLTSRDRTNHALSAQRGAVRKLTHFRSDKLPSPIRGFETHFFFPSSEPLTLGGQFS